MDNWNNDNNYTSYNYGGGVNENLFENNSVSEFSGSFDEPVGSKKPKSKVKYIVIAIIVGIIAMIAFSVIRLVSFLNEEFNITDFDTVNSACKEVFNEEIFLAELNTPYSDEGYTYKIAKLGSAAATTNDVKYTLFWFEFDSEESAKAYFESMDVKYDNVHDEKSAEIGNSNRVSTLNKIDWSYSYKNDSSKKSRYFVAKNGKYAVTLEMSGDAEQVDDYYKSFKKKIK